jgi:hypothetical protein
LNKWFYQRLYGESEFPALLFVQLLQGFVLGLKLVGRDDVRSFVGRKFGAQIFILTPKAEKN